MELEWGAAAFVGAPTVGEDEALARLDEQTDEDEVAYVGPPDRVTDVAEPPIRLRLARPHALSLRRYLDRAGVSLPVDVAAATGPSVPLLLVHHVTAFAPAGQVPPRTFGLGYECTPDGVSAHAVAIAPSAQHQAVARVGGSLQLRAGPGGALDPEQTGVPRRVLERLGDVSIEASADASLYVNLQCGWTRITVLAAPVPAGGAHWDLFGRRRDLREAQALVHTLLVPEGVRSLRVSVRAWARQSAPWLGPRATVSWATVQQTWDLSLDGL